MKSETCQPLVVTGWLLLLLAEMTNDAGLVMRGSGANERVGVVISGPRAVDHHAHHLTGHQAVSWSHSAEALSMDLPKISCW